MSSAARRRQGRSPFLVGAVTLVAIAIFTYWGFTKVNPLHTSFELKAAFKDARNIKPKSPVRIAGVTVGKVSTVESVGDGSPGAIITMEIEDRGLPIHDDATAKVRPRIFLEGNNFVDLQPGSPSQDEMEEGATIPVTRTAAPVGLGQLLEALKDDTREDLRTFLQEYGAALAGGGAEGYNRSIRWWPRAFRDSAIVNDAMLGLEPHDLSGYIRGAGAVAAALDRDPAALKGLITDFAATADALASQERNLQRGIGALDDTLVVGRGALGDLNAALPNLRRLVAELRPATRSARPALDATLPLVTQLRALVSNKEMGGLAPELLEVVPDLVEAQRGGVHFQEESRQLSSCQLDVVVPSANDTIEDPYIPARGKVYQEGVRWLPGVAGESRSFDANGQYIKTQAQTANYAYSLGAGRFFFTTQPVQAVNPPPVPTHPPMRPDVPCETQEPPDLRTIAQAPPRAIKVDHSSAAARRRAAKALKRSTSWLSRELRRTGMSRRFRVSQTPLTRGQLRSVR